MRILVCGGRDFNDYDLLEKTLDEYDITCIIEGGARGADTGARRYAEGQGLDVETFPAKWTEYGRSAGPIRNAQMLDEGKPDCVVAFRGGKGTANMIKLAKEAGVTVREL